MISQQVMDIVYGTKWDEDIQQDFFLFLLENDIELTGTDREVRKQVNKYMANRMHNGNWVEDNRARLVDANKERIRSIYAQNAQYAEDPADILEQEENVKDMLAGLSDTNKRTLKKLYLDGLSPDELADEEGAARNAIDQRVHNIKKQILGETQ